MAVRNLVWLPQVKRKLVQFRSERFSAEETLDFISQFILETQSLLENPVLSKAYTEETGEFTGMSRVVIRNFRVYFEQIENDVVIVAVLFPGEI